MRTIKVEPLTRESFAPFGEYYNMEQPEGYALCGEIHRFYPDRMTNSTFHAVGYSPILVRKPERMTVTAVEYHTTTPEMILPLNDDMIIHVAPASAGIPVPDETHAFLIPKHTLVKINSAIWHLAPLPVKEDVLSAMIVLPECTYANDCTVVNLCEDDQFEIVE